MADNGERDEPSRPLANHMTDSSEEAARTPSPSSFSVSDDAEKARGLEPAGRSSKGANTNRVRTDQSTGTKLPRRDENPFSFKHFLKNDPSTNYQLTGARPKVYSPLANTSPEPSSLDSESGVYARNPTELPDFVQDHLVIEQCYLNHDAVAQPIVDIENLPDFALNSMETRKPRHRSEPEKGQSSVLDDLPFDLTGSLVRRERERSMPNTNHPGPLDLPTFDRPNDEPAERLKSFGLMYNLPLGPSESDPNDAGAAAWSCPPNNATNITKSLPDFLSDGPIRSRVPPPSDAGPGPAAPEPIDRRLVLENERLRQELEAAHRQLEKRSRRIQLLEVELASRKAVVFEETAHLEKAMEQVEDNLKRSTKRAVSAENTVTALKQELKVLMTEISMLRAENRELRGDMGASSNYSGSVNLDRRIRRLATDLRSAASSAEVSLRQLMSGVDNLRVLASALENVDRIEDRTKDFVSDFDEDNAAGPAL